MPGCSDHDDGRFRQVCWFKARAQVEAKFPHLIKGSSGYERAVRNRYDRLITQPYA